jgi:hypothetical protein
VSKGLQVHLRLRQASVVDRDGRQRLWETIAPPELAAAPLRSRDCSHYRDVIGDGDAFTRRRQGGISINPGLNLGGQVGAARVRLPRSGRPGQGDRARCDTVYGDVPGIVGAGGNAGTVLVGAVIAVPV